MPRKRDSYIYSDIDPFLQPTSGGDIKIYYDAEAVFRSVKNIMATVSGERVRNPIGSRLLGLLFEPISDDVAEDISDEIKRVISAHEPRIKNLRVNIKPSIDELTYHVSLSFSIKGLDGSEVMQVPLRAFV